MRGLGRAEKRRAVRLSLEKVRPELIMLQETKLRAGREEVLRGW